MTDLIPFHYADQQVRVITIDGEPHFVLTDLCKILGIINVADVKDRLDDGVAQIYPILDSLGRTQQATIVSEAGMYEVVIRSDKPEAVTFRRWITGEVLPQIRKTGSYSVAEKPRELQIAEALQLSADIIKEQDAKIAELEPSAKAWGHIVAADGSYSVGDAAKMIANAGVSLGRQRLFDQLADWGWIYRDGGRGREAWRAYQSQVECGRLVLKANRPFLNEKTGEYENAAPTIRVTAKGVNEIYRRLTDGKGALLAVTA